MPVNIDVYINDRHIKQYRIGRAEGTTDPDSINTYHILEFEDGDDDLKLWADAPVFKHRYGDGVDVCILKGLEALLASDSSPDFENGGEDSSD